MKLERDIYYLLLRSLTNENEVIVQGTGPQGQPGICFWFMADGGKNGRGNWTWKNVLTEDIECNGAKDYLDMHIDHVNQMLEYRQLDELIGHGGYGNHTEQGTIHNCNRLKELLKLAEFHATLIGNDDIVVKLNTIINIVKEQNIWKE